MESKARYRVSLVVPCYNEAHRLNTAAFRQFLEENGTTRLLFVDDGSRDETFQVLETLCRGHERQAQVLRCGRNRGKAEAVRLGVMAALDHYEQDIIGYCDAARGSGRFSVYPGPASGSGDDLRRARETAGASRGAPGSAALPGSHFCHNGIDRAGAGHL